jgi:hypothetical protein
MDNKMDLKEVEWGGMDWIAWSQEGQVVGTCEGSIKPLVSTKCEEFVN